MYVDDLFVIGNDEQGVAQHKSQLMVKFRMTDLGPVQKYFGVKLKCTTHGISYFNRHPMLTISLMNSTWLIPHKLEFPCMRVLVFDMISTSNQSTLLFIGI